MPDYLKSAQSAARMIAKAGMKASRYRADSSLFDPIRGKDLMSDGTTEEITVLMLPPDFGEVRYSSGKKENGVQNDKVANAKFLIAGTSTEPAPDDIIILANGDRYQVIGCNALSPAGQNILYTIGAQKV